MSVWGRIFSPFLLFSLLHFMKNPWHFLKGMCLTSIWLPLLYICFLWHLKMETKLFSFMTIFDENLKGWRRVLASFALLMYFLQLMHLKDSILCLLPCWQCLWGWEEEILPRAVHGKGWGVSATSQCAECPCPAFGCWNPRYCLKL